MSKATRSSAAVAALLAFITFSSCRPPRPRIVPLPSEVVAVEGYGSVKLVRGGESGRSRFSFVIEAGRRGRLEVLDLLNRAAAEIYIDRTEAVLVLRGERAFWKSGAETLLGLRLGLDDVTALLCGRWAGGRAGFRIDVRETFPGGPVPRRADFSGPSTEGSLTLLAITFNAPRPEGLFDLGFLSVFTAKSWAEIERMIRRED